MTNPEELIRLFGTLQEAIEDILREIDSGVTCQETYHSCTLPLHKPDRELLSCSR